MSKNKVFTVPRKKKQGIDWCFSRNLFSGWKGVSPVWFSQYYWTKMAHFIFCTFWLSNIIQIIKKKLLISISTLPFVENSPLKIIKLNSCDYIVPKSATIVLGNSELWDLWVFHFEKLKFSFVNDLISWSYIFLAKQDCVQCSSQALNASPNFSISPISL